MHRIGEDRSERLDIVPAQLRVIVTVRPKYACRACTDGVTQAPTPPWLIERGLPTEATERGRTFNNVGRTRLLSALTSAIHTGDMTIGNFAARDLLRQELESFEADVGSTGRVRIEGLSYPPKFGH